MAGEWFMGPPGDLRVLVCPDRGVNVSDVRFGGVHQGLSGARTMDVTGVKMQVDLNLSYLTETDYLWLEAMFIRHIPGPVFLINPLKKNLLSKEASISKTSYFPGNGIWSSTASYTHNWTYEASYPTGVPGTRSIKRTVPASSVVFEADSNYKIPVTVGTTYDFSAYMKADSSKTVTYGIAWYDKNYGFLSNTTSAKSVTTAWTRFDVSGTAPASAALAVPFWQSTTNVPFTSTALQFEAAATPTSWQIGGGSMVVLIDQMPTQSPRFPLRNVSLTLLEA